MGAESPGESGRAGNAPRSVDVDPEARAARWLVLEVGAANGNADAGLGGGRGRRAEGRADLENELAES